MRFYLGVTDLDWYSFLSRRENEDINFWQPGGKTTFKALTPGAPFLFKLKHPINKIGGIGFFSTHSILPVNIAWEIFKERNGIASFYALKEKILLYRNTTNSLDNNPNIGCIVLSDPIFFNQNDWIEVPKNWANPIVTGKIYDTSDVIGREVWENVEWVLTKYKLFDREESSKSQFLLEEPEPSYSKKYLTKVRYGQGAFRVKLTDVYTRRCSISGEKTLPVLEAAHIKPYAESGPNHLSNGVLLRADLHKLFDSGYLSLTNDLKVEVSKRIKEEFENGKEYYKYQGQQLAILPERMTDRPDKTYIEWHQNNRFNG